MFKNLLLVFSILCLSMSFVYAAEDDFYTYLKKLRAEISKSWDAPDLPNLYTSEINFKVLKDGSLKDIKTVKSSGSKAMDKKAIEAVSSAGKQKPLPSVYHADSIDVTVQLSSRHIKSVLKKNSKKSYVKTTEVIERKPVKIVKVIFDKNFKGASNFQDNMIKPVFNLDIQNSLKYGSKK